MKYLFHSRIRDDNKTQITIYKFFYKFYKKKATAIDTFAHLFYL